MKHARTLVLILLCLSLASSVSAQSKGNGRINGKILDDQGKPAQNVLVRGMRAGDALVLEARTNDKGEWQLTNLAAGKYTFEFMKEGFDLKLTKAAPTVDPNVEIQAEVGKAVALQKEGKQADARKIITDLIAKYPTAYRLNAFVANTYEAEKNYEKAIEHLKIVADKEPNDVEMTTYMAELLAAKGDKAGAQKLLDSIDMSKVPDPTMFINMAIGSINADKPDEAIATLDKVNKAFPTRADVFYYRARAYIKGKKMAEAKADLEKFVAMAPPDARELADAKKLLEQLKDVK
jgi:predicted Zn-dependent protease